MLLISYGFMMQRAYQWKAFELSKLCDGVEVIIPEIWRELWSARTITADSGPLDSLPHHRLRLHFNYGKHYALLPLGRFVEILRRFDPDVIDYDNEPFNLGSAQVIAMARRYSPRARVYLHAAQNLMKWYPPPFNWVERYVFDRCGGVFARNDAARRILIERGLDAEKITIMGHGVSLEEFSQARRQQEGRVTEGGTVLFIGALTHQKGIDTLLRACAASRAFRTLTIVGDGPEYARLRHLATTLGIYEKTRFLGRVKHSELQNLYGRHACFVLPSRTTPNLVEQFGRVLLEAMAAGCPIIASSSGYIPAVVGEAGVVFREDDVAALTDALDRVLSDEELKADLRKRGLQRVRAQFEWSVVARDMVDRFRQAQHEQ